MKRVIESKSRRKRGRPAGGHQRTPQPNTRQQDGSTSRPNMGPGTPNTEARCDPQTAHRGRAHPAGRRKTGVGKPDQRQTRHRGQKRPAAQAAQKGHPRARADNQQATAGCDQWTSMPTRRGGKRREGREGGHARDERTRTKMTERELNYGQRDNGGGRGGLRGSAKIRDENNGRT